jgi:DNA-binding response OmpR family regulator
MIARPKKRSRVVVVDSKPNDYASLLADKAFGETDFEFFDQARKVLRYSPERDPQLCVINMNLPDMNGLDLYHMVSVRWPDTPVYLVGDDYRPEDEISARVSGATFYFCKPLQSEWLAAATRSKESDLVTV